MSIICRRDYQWPDADERCFICFATFPADELVLVWHSSSFPNNIYLHEGCATYLCCGVAYRCRFNEAFLRDVLELVAGRPHIDGGCRCISLKELMEA